MGTPKKKASFAERRRQMADRQRRAAEHHRRVRRLQYDAIGQGRRWVKCPCFECGGEMTVHVEWRNPVLVCRMCRSADESTERVIYGSDATLVKSKLPTEGFPVSGGLPSLGRRR